jgi:hypothetical protein
MAACACRSWGSLSLSQIALLLRQPDRGQSFDTL